MMYQNKATIPGVYCGAPATSSSANSNNSSGSFAFNDNGDATLASIFALGQTQTALDKTEENVNSSGDNVVDALSADAYSNAYAGTNNFLFSAAGPSSTNDSPITTLPLPRPRIRNLNGSNKPRHRPKIRYERTTPGGNTSRQSTDFTSFVAAMPHTALSNGGVLNSSTTNNHHINGHNNNVDVVDIVDVKVEPSQSYSTFYSTHRLINNGSNGSSSGRWRGGGGGYVNSLDMTSFAQFRNNIPMTEEEKLEAAFYKRQYMRILATERQRQRRAQMSEAERAATREVNRLRNRQRRNELKQLADRALEMGISAETHAKLNALRKSLGMRPISIASICKPQTRNEFVAVKTEMPHSDLDFYIQPATSVEQIVARSSTIDNNEESHNSDADAEQQADFNRLMNDLANNMMNHKKECENAYYVRERARLLKTQNKRKKRTLTAEERAKRQEKRASRTPQEEALYEFARRQRRQRARRLAARSAAAASLTSQQYEDVNRDEMCFEGKPARNDADNLAALTAQQLDELAEYEKRKGNVNITTLDAELRALLDGPVEIDGDTYTNQRSKSEKAVLISAHLSGPISALFHAIEKSARKCRTLAATTAYDNNKCGLNNELEQIKAHIAEVEAQIRHSD